MAQALWQGEGLKTLGGEQVVCRHFGGTAGASWRGDSQPFCDGHIVCSVFVARTVRALGQGEDHQFYA